MGNNFLFSFTLSKIKQKVMATLEFNDMLLSNADFLKPFAINLTRDTEAANDLYQETLYKALANKEKYNAGTNIKAWLFTIMRNIFINNFAFKFFVKAVSLVRLNIKGISYSQTQSGDYALVLSENEA